MLRNGPHSVVADSCGQGATCPGWVAEEGVEATVAAVVEVDVDAAVVGEDEVTNGVGALDGEVVAVEVGEGPGVFGCYEVAGFCVGPELLFPLANVASPIHQDW